MGKGSQSIRKVLANSCWCALLLQVQHNWMYLENIFIGSEDIRKQLPQESLMFEGVHHAFMRSMAWLHSVGNVVRATTGQGVLAAFQVQQLPVQRCLYCKLQGICGCVCLVALPWPGCFCTVCTAVLPSPNCGDIACLPGTGTGCSVPLCSPGCTGGAIQR
jgi:hypothetical protein